MDVTAGPTATQLEIIKLNLGALESGAGIVTFLFGVLTVQMYMYATMDFRDRFVLNSLVSRTVRFEV